jgi:hypothetical protein
VKRLSATRRALAIGRCRSLGKRRIQSAVCRVRPWASRFHCTPCRALGFPFGSIGAMHPHGRAGWKGQVEEGRSGLALLRRSALTPRRRADTNAQGKARAKPLGEKRRLGSPWLLPIARCDNAVSAKAECRFAWEASCARTRSRRKARRPLPRR